MIATAGTVKRIGVGVVQSTSVAVGVVLFDVRKRANPSITFNHADTGIAVQHGGGGSTSTSLAAAHIQDTSFHIQVTQSTAPFTVGFGVLFYTSLVASFVEISAEL